MCVWCVCTEEIAEVAEATGASDVLIRAIDEASLKTELLDVRTEFEKVLAEYGDVMDPRLRIVIDEYIATLVDPNELLIWSLEDRGFINEGEAKVWYEEARERFKTETAQVMVGEKPTLTKNYDTIRPVEDLFMREAELLAEQDDRVVTLRGADASSLALQEAMDNPDVVLFVTGVDAKKGKKPLRQKITGTIKRFVEGGYFGESTLVTRLIGAWTNTSIDENTAMGIVAGMAETSVRLAKSGARIVANLAYVDYAIESFASILETADTLMTTDAQVTRPWCILAHAGQLAGGGTGHVNEYVGKIASLPESVHVYYPSTPEDLYKLLTWHIRGKSVKPAVILWDRLIYAQKQKFNVALEPESKPGRGRAFMNEEKERNKVQCISVGPSHNELRQSIEVRKAKEGKKDSIFRKIYSVKKMG